MPLLDVRWVTHPAKFSPEILDVAQGLVSEHARGWAGLYRILDPFAGEGGVHVLAVPGRRVTVGVEIEPDWALKHRHRGTLIGDAKRLPFRDCSFAAVVTSPPYGNRFADAYAGDGTTRYSYRIGLGRPLSPNNGGALHWYDDRRGDPYRELHMVAWREALRVLRPGGIFVLNVSDHVQAGTVRHVSAWHLSALERLRAEHRRTVDVRTRRNGNGANRDARPEFEHVHLFTRKARTDD